MGTCSGMPTAIGTNAIAVPTTLLPLTTSNRWVVPLLSVTLCTMIGFLAAPAICPLYRARHAVTPVTNAPVRRYTMRSPKNIGRLLPAPPLPHAVGERMGEGVVDQMR